jgi:hypothetical protein
MGGMPVQHDHRPGCPEKVSQKILKK